MLSGNIQNEVINVSRNEYYGSSEESEKKKRRTDRQRRKGKILLESKLEVDTRRSKRNYSKELKKD